MMRLSKNSRWIKPCGFHSLTVLDSEVAAIHSSSCILFLPPDGLQLIYEATTYLKGRGVKCLAGCPTEPLFAFAEKCSTDPRILVLTYPAFEKIAILSGNKRSFVSSGQQISFHGSFFKKTILYLYCTQLSTANFIGNFSGLKKKSPYKWAKLATYKSASYVSLYDTSRLWTIQVGITALLSLET